MTQLAQGLPKPPPNMACLPLDPRGYPVPKFVWHKDDGTYDFRVIEPGWPVRVVRQRLCWLCGTPRWAKFAAVVGPMCTINRNIGEPNFSHLECARWAVQACPFLRFPNRKRDEHELPTDAIKPGGDEAMIMRNPGVTALYITKSFRPYRANDGSVLYALGEPSEVEWWAHGRKATRSEIIASIDSGLPLLRAMAEKEGPEAIIHLEKTIERGLKLVPAASYEGAEP